MTANRLNKLDALRGLAALSVAWFHIYQKNEVSLKNPAIEWVADLSSAYGYMGVPLFFIISGFVIPYVTINRAVGLQNGLVFLFKRGLRLHPVYLASILAAILTAYAAT